MARRAAGDLEELALCPRCRRAVDERAPEPPACQHSSLALARRLAPDPECRAEAALLLADVRRLAARQRGFLLRALDAATTLKVRLEAELAAPPPERALSDLDYSGDPLGAAAAERDRLRALHAEMLLQCQLDDLICNAGVPLDFELMRKALAGLGAGVDWPRAPAAECRDPVLFLANYCSAQLYTRRCLTRRGGADGVAATLEIDAAPAPSPVRNPAAYPLFYFNVEVDGAPFGRVVIEVREDIAPRMARNFSMLATGELGVGYRGCSVFQCWENESIITGDFELNNGRGGRSVYEEHFFPPDETKLVAVRGTVGMRRCQKRHDNVGMVGSQFRIILREMRGFTAIFAFVVEGLELVDRLSRAGDGAGKPHSAIVIAGCGKLN